MDTVPNQWTADVGYMKFLENCLIIIIMIVLWIKSNYLYKLCTIHNNK